MIQVLVIADDLTGALDTGVQLASCGAKTKVITDPKADLGLAAKDCEILVVDAKTRHLSRQEAYDAVKRLVEKALDLNIPYLYKKTDSALRGNIGAELEALLMTSKEEQLFFMPAFPQMRRTVREGISYIDDIPVADSVFGKDPFEPVSSSSIQELILLESSLPVTVKKAGESAKEKGIVVYDASSMEDLKKTGQRLKEEGKLRVMAGCAGFASLLVDLLEVPKSRREGLPKLEKRFLVICGSVNPITLLQLEEGERQGFHRIRLNTRQKLEKGYWGSLEGNEDLKHLCKELEIYPRAIIDSNDPEGNETTRDYMRDKGLELEEVRQHISYSIGQMVNGLFKTGSIGTILITGGDTLRECIEAMGVKELEPIAEVAVGVVLFRFMYKEKPQYLISKSGGFGEKTLLNDMMSLILEGGNKE